MTYDLSKSDPLLPGELGRPVEQFRFRNATVRDAATLRLRLDQWQQHIRTKVVPKAFKRAAGRLLVRLVRGNPVGNPSLWKRPARRGYVGGHSRSNWQIKTNPLAVPLPGVKPLGQVVSEGIAAVAALPASTRRIYIANPVAYAERLNRGWSRQAPAGWHQVAIAQTNAELRKIK